MMLGSKGFSGGAAWHIGPDIIQLDKGK